MVAFEASSSASRETGPYTEAGSANAVVIRVAQAMMKGEPLDAGAERAALLKKIINIANYCFDDSVPLK